MLEMCIRSSKRYFPWWNNSWFSLSKRSIKLIVWYDALVIKNIKCGYLIKIDVVIIEQKIFMCLNIENNDIKEV